MVGLNGRTVPVHIACGRHHTHLNATNYTCVSKFTTVWMVFSWYVPKRIKFLHFEYDSLFKIFHRLLALKSFRETVGTFSTQHASARFHRHKHIHMHMHTKAHHELYALASHRIAPKSICNRKCMEIICAQKHSNAKMLTLRFSVTKKKKTHPKMSYFLVAKPYFISISISVIASPYWLCLRRTAFCGLNHCFWALKVVS